ncbi:MAG: hypothetical protein R3C05_02770 [Pirellulaceae bacterium]
MNINAQIPIEETWAGSDLAKAGMIGQDLSRFRSMAPSLDPASTRALFSNRWPA